MNTQTRISIAIFACLLLLAAGCDKGAKAKDSAQAPDTTSSMLADGQTDMQADSNADGGMHDMDHRMDMDHPMDMTGDDVTKSTSPATGNPYTLAFCPVSGEEIGEMGDPVHYNYKGRDIAFCCKDCIAKFEADPTTYITKIDGMIIAEQSASYPLDVCPVSGEKLGEEGASVDRVFDNRLVRFCCEDCVKDFEADPAKYFSKLDEAVIKAQSESYPLATCPVSGEQLGEEGAPVNYVVGTTLVKLCCEDCRKDVAANPAKYIQMIDDAKAAKGA